ncbi:MAG: serine/threonine protein kinase [Chitinispirillales bacterium]|jgi:tRNA A-37 threonylcarbamoyl transferase component Bud32|nr:serine/threonine protein kinase [Chitinispirillales bacterium]
MQRHIDKDVNQSGAGATSFGRYRVLGLLGEGAMGRVYLSEDPILKRRVAVKVIPTDRNLEPALQREFLERFAVEAQACAMLNHPSIVSIYDAGEEGGAPWIAFEYVSGEHLDMLLAQKTPLPFDRILRIAGDIAAAMRHAHGMGIVHRDIKPANILIDEASGIAKLADFGVVKSPHAAITQSGTAVGSPGYMSPEQIDDLKVDARSDIFSFGVVLYEMLTGVHPFLRDTVQATFYATLSCHYKPIRELRADAPEKLVKFVEMSLVADRNLRIINSDELCSMIAECLSDDETKTRMLRIGAANRGAAKQAGFALARVLRKIRSLKKAMPPVANRAVDAVGAVYKKSVLPFAQNIVNKVYCPLEKRFSRKRLTIALISVTSLMAAVVLILLFASVSSKMNDGKRLVRAAQEKGYTVRNGKQLIGVCREYIDRCDYFNASELAGILTAGKGKNYVLSGSLFNAMAALCADRFNDAATLFANMQELKGGEAAIRKEHSFYIRYLEAWIERELPDSLITLCATRLYLHDNDRVKTWLTNEHYWIRWNAVYIREKGGKKVDLVPVYILDLDYSASARTKIRAAEKLGDLGDRRAIPALTAARDGRNPASSTARRILREKFNVW